MLLENRQKKLTNNNMGEKFKIGDNVRLVSDTNENVAMEVRGYVFDIEMSYPPNTILRETLRSAYEGLVRCEWTDKNNSHHKNVDYWLCSCSPTSKCFAKE